MASQSQNLTLGSGGKDVSDLQTMLKQHQLYNGPISGTYDASTQNAVKQFQQLAGIQADGIYGPQTTAVFNNWQQHPIKFALAEPAVQQQAARDPQLAATLQYYAQNPGNQADVLGAANLLSKSAAASGAQNPGYLDSNGNLDTDIFSQMALNQLSPSINQSLNYYTGDFKQSLANEKAQYQNQLSGAQQSLTNQGTQVGNAVGAGQNGSVNSGYGQQVLSNFKNAANAQLGAIQQSGTTSLSGLARNYEQQLGSAQLGATGQNFNIAGGGSFGANGQYTGAPTTSAYSQLGGQQGQLTTQWLGQLTNRANQLANGSLPQAPAYNQYLGAATVGGSPNNLPYGIGLQ